MRRLLALVLAVGLLLVVGSSAVMGSSDTAQDQSVRVVVDYSDGFSGWRVFGSGLLQLTSEQAVSGSSSIKLTGRTASWNGAALDLDSILTDGGTYRFSIYVRLASLSEILLGT